MVRAEEAENFSLLNLKVNTRQCDNVSGPCDSFEESSQLLGFDGDLASS